MTLYARSDLVQVTYPVDQGGCGQTHTRPVVNGAPEKVFALDCGKCEAVIRAEVSIREQKHPLWSGTLSGIPETPDEKAVREDETERGKQEAAVANRSALESLSTLPQVLQNMMTMMAGGQLPAIGQSLAQSVSTCPSGHPNLGQVKFCGECGVPMSAPRIVVGSLTTPPVGGAPTATLQTEAYTRGGTATVTYEPDLSTSAPIDVSNASTAIETSDLGDKPLAVLREMARAAGLPTRRSRAEQVAVLEGREG